MRTREERLVPSIALIVGGVLFKSWAFLLRNDRIEIPNCDEEKRGNYVIAYLESVRFSIIYSGAIVMVF